MCGLTGLFDFKTAREFDPALIQAMTDAVAHRGPDGEGIYHAPGVALGHRRLAFIDLAGGIQPMHTVDGALTIVFNGEIYNFPDLMAELKAAGAQFQTRSDTEVILHGWLHWGRGLFSRLRALGCEGPDADPGPRPVRQKADALCGTAGWQIGVRVRDQISAQGCRS